MSDTIDTPVDKFSQPVLNDDNELKLALFGINLRIVCRETQEEAEAVYDHVHRQVGDYEGAAHVTGVSKAHSQSTDWTIDERRLLEGMIAGFRAIPVVGSPNHVAKELLALHEAGADGIAISFVDYDEGLEQFETQLFAAARRRWRTCTAGGVNRRRPLSNGLAAQRRHAMGARWRWSRAGAHTTMLIATHSAAGSHATIWA